MIMKEQLIKEFQKNQKKIDSRKTSKDERKQFILRNREILTLLRNIELTDYEKGMVI